MIQEIKTVKELTNDSIKVVLVSGKESTFSCSVEKLAEGLYNYYHLNMLVQNAFYFLSPDEREFLMSGLTGEEYDNLFDNA